jgi:hypothetical protein
MAASWCGVERTLSVGKQAAEQVAGRGRRRSDAGRPSGYGSRTVCKLAAAVRATVGLEWAGGCGRASIYS